MPFRPNRPLNSNLMGLSSWEGNATSSWGKPLLNLSRPGDARDAQAK